MTIHLNGNAMAEADASKAIPPPPVPPRLGKRSLHLVGLSEGDATQSTPAPQAGAPALTEPARNHAVVRLERELMDVEAEVLALQELLNELPSIYETKFVARLALLRKEQQDLERDNRALRRHLLVLAPERAGHPLPVQPRGLLAPAIRATLKLR